MTSILTTLYLVTLNIWGLPEVGFKVLSPLREERVSFICEELKEKSKTKKAWEVVLLQEAWVQGDREKLKNCGYPYFVDQDDESIGLGSGLLILSQYPILASQKLIYPALPKNGDEFENGEAFVKKGALFAKIKLPNDKNIWVANTHLVSFYAGKDIYEEIRLQQFKKFIERAQVLAKEDLLIVGGDWNMGPGFPLWQKAQQILSQFTAGEKEGCTICPPNTMHKKNKGKVDHLFVSLKATVVSADQAFTRPLQFQDFTIHPSDHFGWEFKILIE